MSALCLLNMNAPLKPNIPYVVTPQNQMAFGTLGPPFIAQLSTNSAVTALKAAWFQKWKVARRLRPEVMAARIDRHKRSLFTYPIHSDVLNSAGAALINQTFGGWLLPQAFPEGSPLHSSYAAGHGEQRVCVFCYYFLKEKQTSDGRWCSRHTSQSHV